MMQQLCLARWHALTVEPHARRRSWGTSSRCGDMVGGVMATFGAWHATLWDKIKVDELVEDTRKMIRDLKTLNKAVRGYDVYRCGPPAAAGPSVAA